MTGAERMSTVAKLIAQPAMDRIVVSNRACHGFVAPDGEVATCAREVELRWCLASNDHNVAERVASISLMDVEHGNDANGFEDTTA